MFHVWYCDLHKNNQSCLFFYLLLWWVTINSQPFVNPQNASNSHLLQKSKLTIISLNKLINIFFLFAFFIYSTIAYSICSLIHEGNRFLNDKKPVEYLISPQLVQMDLMTGNYDANGRNDWQYGGDWLIFCPLSGGCLTQRAVW